MKKKNNEWVDKLAERFGITQRRVRQLAAQGMPTHDEEAAAEWYTREIDRYASRNKPLSDARTNLVLIETRRKQMEIDRMEGRLVEIDVAKRAQTEIINALRKAYRNLESVYALQLSFTPEQCDFFRRKWAEAEIRAAECLRETAKNLPS